MRRRIAALAAVTLMAALLPTLAGTGAVAQVLPPVTVVPLQITGPPAERLNLVILGDGYTAAEMQTFRDDVDRNQNVQWATEPFRSYRNYFNVYRVEIESPVSGISCDPDDGNIRRNTPLNLQFAGTCPADPLARGITYGSGGAAMRNAILDAHLAPLGVEGQNVQTLAIANTFTYGGIGGTHATTSGGSPQGPLISLHELGHSLGNLQDEYPYSSRDVIRDCYSGGEPSSIHHTLMTDQEMLDAQAKYWRWLGEESLSGGFIRARGPDGHEGGLSRPCGIWRASEHSMMRWLGFPLDQVGREHMTQRITGRRNDGNMSLLSTPAGEVGATDVVWVETPHPKFHELDITWRVNGAVVAAAEGSQNLELADLDVAAGDTIEVTVSDPTEFVRDPFYADGPRMTQTRTWTVGAPLPEADVEVAFTLSTPTHRATAGDEVVFVETTHPNDRLLDVTWELDGEELPNPGNSRTLDLTALDLAPGTYDLEATVTDPADPGGASDAISWIVDNTLPTAPRTLSEPLTKLPADGTHNVYWDEFDMGLEPVDDQPGFVVGEFRLDRDGWFNYFGFPEQPHGTPFTFSHSGKVVKALTYGNLGTGGLSKAAFEQSPQFGFVPGFGTHTIEHRAIDAAGNIGEAEEYTATVLPSPPACTTTITGVHSGALRVSGTACLQGATVRGPVRVEPGASLVAIGASISGPVSATGADHVQLIDTRVAGTLRVAGTSGQLTLINDTVTGSTVLSDTDTPFLAAVANTTFGAAVACSGNAEPFDDLGAANAARHARDCAGL